jgi:uncharacterized membrane protein
MLHIAIMNTTTSSGRQLFETACQRYGVQRRVVPMLVIGRVALVGSEEIPSRLVGLIEKHLVVGGIDWPDLPGLADGFAGAEFLPRFSVPPLASIARHDPADSQSIPTWCRQLVRDPVGNTVALLVLIGMIATLVRCVLVLGRTCGPSPRTWTIPAVALIGLAIAVYLAQVELRDVDAACGPIGDCATVQQSEYARLFGFIPVGVLGVGGYLFILAASRTLVSRDAGRRWLAGHSSPRPWLEQRFRST